MVLLCLRTTPHNRHQTSPAEIRYNRKIRTRIPTFLNTNKTKDNDPGMDECQKQEATTVLKMKYKRPS